jgi:hypothetical protein
MFGAKDLGIAVDWKFQFKSEGSSLDPLPCTVFVDTGNKLTYGIIDTHQAVGHESSSSALVANPHFVLNHLMQGLNETYARGFGFERNEITFIYCTHANPDWDSVASFCLCDHLVREGKFPAGYQALTEAADEIDQGRVRIADAPVRPFTVYNAIINNQEDRDECARRAKEEDEANWESLAQEKFFGQALLLGCEMLNLILAGKPKTKDAFLRPMQMTGEFEKFSKYAEMLIEDKQKFEENEEELVEKFDLELPVHPIGTTKSNEREIYKRTKAFAFRKGPPTSQLFKFWVRQQPEYGVMLVPKPGMKKWVVSVDPHSDYTLHRLGYILEKEETKARDGKPSRARRGPARWGDEKYCDNQDPWYDGRDKQYSIVDSPYSGTDLEYDDIKRVLQGRFYGVNLSVQPKIRLYYFFEQKGLQNPDAEKTQPLAGIPGAVQFIQQIGFDRLTIDCGAQSENFSATICSSQVTKHGVLEIVVEKFEGLSDSVDCQNLILEELPEIVQMVELAAVSSLLPEIEEKYGFENHVWGSQCLKLIEMQDLDLNFHDQSKIKFLLEKLCNADVEKQKLEDVYSSTSSLDLVSGINTVCLTSSSDYDGAASFRSKVFFYVLFLKTAYRCFSERLGKTAEKLSGDLPANTIALRHEIQEIQKDYAQFLASYAVSTVELSLDGKVQNFYNRVTNALSLDAQRKSTAEDMRGLADLADSLDQELTKERADKLNAFLATLGVLSLGEVLFMVFDKRFTIDPPPVDKGMAFLGLCSFSFLVGVLVWLFLKVHKKRVRNQVDGVIPHSQIGDPRTGLLKVFLASFAVLLVGGLIYICGERLAAPAHPVLVFSSLSGIALLSGVLVWLFAVWKK